MYHCSGYIDAKLGIFISDFKKEQTKILTLSTPTMEQDRFRDVKVAWLNQHRLMLIY